MNFFDTHVSFGENADGLYYVRRQEIPDDYLDTLKSERIAKATLRAAEMDRIASVPAQVWDIWCAQGRDPWNASAKQIVAWLQRDDLNAFITTPKRI